MAAAMLGGEGCHHVDVTPKATRKATKPAHAKHATPRSSRPEAFPAAGAGGADAGDGASGAPLASSRFPKSVDGRIGRAGATVACTKRKVGKSFPDAGCSEDSQGKF